jgi:hypothetical protein
MLGALAAPSSTRKSETSSAIPSSGLRQAITAATVKHAIAKTTRTALQYAA